MEWRNRRGSAAARPTLTRDGFLKIYRETTERESENITDGVGESTGGTLVEGDRTWGDDELSAHATGFARKFPIFARSLG